MCHSEETKLLNFFTNNTDFTAGMASASSHPCEEQHQCSICLDVFVQPVTTPCGHNYCHNCITEYWSSSGLIQCPLCNKRFHSKPELQVNTEFRDMVERLNNMRPRGDEILVKPGEVPCDICPELKLKAQKTCMECLVSFCQCHLEPHLRVTALKKHKLIDPVSNLEERMCERHGKMFELFCRTDEMCICSVCLKDSHVMHEAVPLEHVCWERKAQLENVTSEMKMMEDTKTRSIEEMKYSIEQRKKELDKDMADIDEVFAALVASLQRSKAKLIESIQETEKAAEKQVEDQVTQLEQQVKELRSKRSKIKRLLQTEDDLHFLLSLPSLDVPAFNQKLFHSLSSFIPTPTHDLSDSSQQSYLRMVKKAVTQMDNTLSNEMEMLIHKVQLSDGCENAGHPDAAASPITDEFIKEVWNPPQDNLMMIQQCHAVDVTLDAWTVHSRLMMSDNGKELRFSRSVFQKMLLKVMLWDASKDMPVALGKDGYSSGRFYYEVRVSGSKCWALGVVKEPFKYENGAKVSKWGWSIHGMSSPHGSFVATAKAEGLYRQQMPHTVGVFVDYEKGEVSFYDVGARALMYSYTGCDFTENIPIAKSLLHLPGGYPSSGRQKLYPIFSIFGDDSDVLVITPVAHAN